MISYSKAVQYASIFVPPERTRDLVHDLYINLNRKGIDLFGVSKRFVYVAMYNFHRNQSYQSIINRNHYKFLDITDYQIRSKTPNPEQIMIGAQLEETFSPYLRLSIEGYTLEEIAQQTGICRKTVSKRINNELSNRKRRRAPYGLHRLASRASA